ncbi:hypothetical protein [Bacillus xiapuensis]|uniref:Transposase n=1 Tax=Bacillus xiapuensis TaxID=2014075 RepID=A0ABU6NAQ1_9BACI|nr:hypothetical protein [Bacillus xiapuensis]
MFIRGAVQFHTKKEKLSIWKQLKQEFNGRVKIIISEGFLYYSAKVDRNFL